MTFGSDEHMPAQAETTTRMSSRPAIASSSLSASITGTAPAATPQVPMCIVILAPSLHDARQRVGSVRSRMVLRS